VERAGLAGRAESRGGAGRGQDRPARRVHGGGAPGARRRSGAGAGPLASGSQFDPALAALLCAEADTIFAGLDAVPAWRAVIAAEPALAVELSPAELDAALTAIANSWT